MPPKKSSPAVVIVEKPAPSVPKKAKKKKDQMSYSAGRKVTGRDIGSSIGGWMGGMAQHALQTIMGHGDYTVTNNTLFNGMVRSSGPPKFVEMNPGCTTIRHREYIQDVSSAGSGFSITTLPINPTSPLTFPWLNNIANNFESYKFNGLIFEFVTNSATAVASTNTALGTVILATQYNLDDPAFSSKLQMEQYEYAVSTVPSESCIHPIECKRDSGVLEYLYTYNGGSGDPRFTTFGNFSVATVGQQAVSNIGELWVSYDITLCKSRLTPFPSVFQFHASFQGTGASNVMGYGSSSANIFAPPTAVVTYGSSNNLPIILGTTANGNPNSLLFPFDAVGTFLVFVNTFSNGGTTQNIAGTSAFTGLQLVNLLPSSGGPATAGSFVAANFGQVSFTQNQLLTVKVLPGNSNSITPTLLLGTTYPVNNTTTWLDIWVIETTEVN
jgi:hypothetical protein